MKKNIAPIIIVFFISIITNGCFDQKNCPENIEQLFDSYFREILNINPELATELGVTDDMGVTVARNKLTDMSEKAAIREYNLMRTFRTCLGTFDKTQLSQSQRLDMDILKWNLDMVLRGKQFRHNNYIINPMFGVHNNLTTLMTDYHSIESIQDAEDYISRLKQYESKFNQLLEQLAIRKEKGIIPPRFILEMVEKEMSDFVQLDAKKNVLYTSFCEKVNLLNGIESRMKENLFNRVENHIDTFVYPSYKRFISHITSLKAQATDDAGVWKLPDGDEYYEYCLNLHTTTSLSPEEIHQLGINEVDRIQKEMIEIFKTLVTVDGKAFSEIGNQYWTAVVNEKHQQIGYPNTDEGRTQVLVDFQEIIRETEKRIPQLFSLIPETPVKVKQVPEFKENTMPTHYSPASLDGKRLGVFYANLGNFIFKPGMRTLAFHETIPGHHFQFAIQQESPDNRKFKNLLSFTGFVEGWALYAEKLGLEHGWFEDDYSKLGYLNSELFRAVRLVVDTGIHYKKWSRDQAYSYMVENLGWGSYLEIDRYIVFPGQACAYKVGELKLLELRKHAQEQLGEKFDIKDFHRMVLKHGSLPLEILTQIVNDYIKENKSDG